MMIIDVNIIMLIYSKHYSSTRNCIGILYNVLKITPPPGMNG